MGRKATGIAFVISASAKGVTAAASETTSAFAKMQSGIAGGFAFMDHAIRVAQKAWRMLNGTIGDLIRTSLDFRAKGDGINEQFADFAKSITLVKARLGDALLPTLQAFMDTTKPLLVQLQKWLVANNKLIATKFAEWTLDLARGLINVVVPAIGLAGAAFYGWKMIFETIAAAWAGANYLFISGLEKIFYGLSKWKMAMGDQDAAVEFFQTYSTLHEMAGEAAKKLDEQTDAIGETAKGYDRFKASIAGVKTELNGLADTMEKAAGKRIKDSVTGANDALKDQKDAVVDISDVLANIPATSANGPYAALLTQLGLYDEARRASFNEQMAQLQMLEDRAQQFGSALGSTFAAFAAGTITSGNAAKAMLRTVIGAVREAAIKSIEAGAAKSAVEAFSSQAGIPVVGPVLAVAAASAAFAFAEAYLSKFNTGGFVGGFGHRDTVPAILTPGEYVMSEREVGNGRADWQRGGSNVSVALTVESLTPDSDGSFIRKAGRHIEKLVSEAIEAGRIPVRAAT